VPSGRRCDEVDAKLQCSTAACSAIALAYILTATASNTPDIVCAAAAAAAAGTVTSQVEEIEATVHGNIPDWLDGGLVMNGGGDYTSMRHLFDGYGMLSKVQRPPAAVQATARHICSSCSSPLQCSIMLEASTSCALRKQLLFRQPPRTSADGAQVLGCGASMLAASTSCGLCPAGCTMCDFVAQFVSCQCSC
jgi:hypothetical protein